MLVLVYVTRGLSFVDNIHKTENFIIHTVSYTNIPVLSHFFNCCLYYLCLVMAGLSILQTPWCLLYTTKELRSAATVFRGWKKEVTVLCWLHLSFCYMHEFFTQYPICLLARDHRTQGCIKQETDVMQRSGWKYAWVDTPGCVKRSLFHRALSHEFTFCRIRGNRLDTCVQAGSPKWHTLGKQESQTL